MEYEGPLKQIAQIAQQLREGNAVPPVTVRELLSWFGAKRRSSSTVLVIQLYLIKNGLQTQPDFESAYIDSHIIFILNPKERTEEPPLPQVQPATTAGVNISDGATLTVRPSFADPTYRISRLQAANNPPVYVAPDAPLEKAVTIMMANDFSQLPVMTNEREVKGIISWTSIGTRLSHGRDDSYTRELMDVPHQEIRANASLFQAIPIVVQHQYVLVRGDDKRICGIITGSDLNLQFQQLTEPFLLLGEIENHIRRLIRERFTKEELAGARDPGDTDRQVDGVKDLTLGEYIRLLQDPDRWQKLKLSIDRAEFCKYLEGVRTIRNDVMHFDPDGIPPEDLDRLRDFTRFLQRLQDIGVP